MNKIKSSLVAAAILACFSGAALAAGSFYGAVDVGNATVKNLCDDTAGLSCNDTDTTFQGSLGYQVNSSLGLEASYRNNIGEYKISNGVNTVTATGSGFQFSAVGSLPVSKDFALTGKLGIALTEGKVSCPSCPYSASASNTTVAYGIGARYNINKTVAVRAQYEDLGKIKVDSEESGAKVTVLSFGVIFGF